LRFLEWLHRPELGGERLRQLVGDWESAQSEAGERSIASWRTHERALAARLAGAVEAAQLVEGAIATYDQRVGLELNKLWRKALGCYRMTIPVEDRRRLERGRDSLDRLEEFRIDSDRHARQLRTRFEADLLRWRDLGGEWARVWLDQPVREANEYWAAQLPESQTRWSRSRAKLVAGLRAFFEVLGGALDSARLRAEDRILVLSRETCDRLREARAVIPAVCFTPPILGPALEAEADSILRRFLILRSSAFSS
jgi:hypothetical protein